MEYIKEMIDYFDNEIKQYNMILQGDISEDYREHIQKKINYYNVTKMMILTHWT